MKKLQLLLVLSFSLFQFFSFAQEVQDEENSWKGPFLLEGYQISSEKNNELTDGTFQIMLAKDGPESDVKGTVADLKFPGQQTTTPFSQILLDCGDGVLLKFFGFHYIFENHLLISGKYRIENNYSTVETGVFAFFNMKFHDTLIENALTLLFEGQESSETERASLNAEDLTSHKWKMSSINLRDRLDTSVREINDFTAVDLIAGVTETDLELSFDSENNSEGSFTLTGLPQKWGDIKLGGELEGTYKVFGGFLILLEALVGDQKFKKLIRVASYDENHITVTTGTFLFGSDVYDLDGLQFEDTITLIPVVEETEDTDEK